jgi:acyl-CoA synthetase (AMP-forming)/AMP-acid ligase II
VDTFSDLIRQAGAQFGGEKFLLDDDSLDCVSYAELQEFSTGLERVLTQHGIPPGAAVATLFHNCGMAAMLFLATIANRRVLVPLNPLSTGYELDYILSQSKCVAVLYDPAHTKARNFGGLITLPIPDHRQFFAECRKAREPGADVEPLDSTDAFAGEIVFTSGSTGRPKGVVLSEGNLLANAGALATVYDLRSSDRFLTVCPLFHNSGQVLTTLACSLVGGSTVAIKSDVGMLHFWHYVDKYRPQWSLGMTSFLALLLTRNELPKNPEFRALLTGGSAIDGALIERFESRFGVPVRTVYGLTETASISTCEFLDPSPRSIGSSGRPLPMCQIRIEAPEEAPHTSSPTGEILISGPHVFREYVGDPELTQHRKPDEWLRTGDIGYFDAQGNLFVIDRMDSMLIVGGENVYPAEVEKLCSMLPGAAQIILTAVEHPIWGHELVLVYKTDAGVTPSMASWHRIMAAQLSAAKIPQRYVSLAELGLNEFPRRPNGKLDRPALASQLARRDATAKVRSV